VLVVWIVLAVVLAVALVGLVVVVPPRARARRARRSATTAPAPPAAPAAAPPAPAPGGAAAPPRAPEAAPPRAEGAPEAPPEEAPEALEPPAVPELRTRLKTRGLLSGYVRSLRSRGSVTDDDWDELEVLLLRADVGVATTTALLDDLRDRVRGGELRGPDAVADALRADLLRSLELPDVASGNGSSFDGAVPDGVTSDGATQGDDASRTPVWLFVGVNGVGKTTTIGKMARRHAAEGRSVLLAAGDTFRAAAVEQLAHWAQRTGAELVRGAEGGDPSSVVFDAVQRASARGHDVVLADTAGRLHTKVNLVEELKKIRRVADRPPGHVTEVLLVLDATTGQNGLTQAREFLGAVGVTGVVLTKLDGSAKGGIVIAIQRELGLPVRYVGLGEGPDDLVPFDPAEFVDALFD
jgi:fused signal recognition particle receptor